MFEPCKYYSPVTDVTFRKVFGENIDLATSLLEVINYNEAEQYLYDKYWDAVIIEATWKGIGRREGEKEGMEKGRELEKRFLAHNMLADGLEPAVVAKYTKLSEEELQKMMRE